MLLSEQRWISIKYLCKHLDSDVDDDDDNMTEPIVKLCRSLLSIHCDYYNTLKLKYPQQHQ